MNYDQGPAVIFWETTRACALVCRHCRAEAQPKRHPLELTTQQGFALLDRMADFDNRPIVILTGGDVMMRRDVFDLISYGLETGLIVSLSPSATALVRPHRLRRAYEAGLSRISFSLDGARPQTHDAFRGVAGSFQRTQECISDAVDAGLSVQINTTVTRYSLPELEELKDIVEGLNVTLWDLFFLVPTGRALRQDMISPEEHEQVFNWMYDVSKTSSYGVRATLGQHYRRVAMQRRHGGDGGAVSNTLSRRFHEGTTNDGKGVCFISHTGEVQPSGFLPITAGNVRTAPLAELYRNAPIFKELRNPELLRGKCGACPFRAICGGCRARAYALTGDYLAAEPCCVYQPGPQ